MVSTWIWDACLQQFQWKADGAFSEYFILHTEHRQTWFTRLPGSVPRQPPVKNGWLFHLGIYLVMPGAICVLCGGTWSSEKMLQDTTSWLLRCLVFSILHSPTLLRVQYSLYLPWVQNISTIHWRSKPIYSCACHQLTSHTPMHWMDIRAKMCDNARWKFSLNFCPLVPAMSPLPCFLSGADPGRGNYN